MRPLDPALLEAHLVRVTTDSPFQQRARLLQALWRERRGLAMGTTSSRVDATPLGSRLDPEPAGALENFLTPEVKRRVRREVQAPDRDRERLFSLPRLSSDLLSSQSLCFNLFAELDVDRALATKVFRDLAPDDVDEVSHLAFGYSPGRSNTKYLGDRSAFDVLVVHTTPRGGWGFVGIEAKYHENMRTAKAALEGKAHAAVAKKARCFSRESMAELEQPPLQQLWLGHLLALSMTSSSDGWETGRFVVLAPRLNDRCAEVVERYAACLTDASSFGSWTLEEVHAAIARHSRAPWVREFADRYLGFAGLDE